ncbi:uncharacterized protein LOC116342315 [Contarinia nasturtii]|uniref:uncharacterized protein LOC116342315 n=1 Tax=Contarinia nasturtii TaxID=265458 RepID=UPI0012D3839B|nr:uncharacterized protein LOC116342315 [Contarinia nasturtii]
MTESMRGRADAHLEDQSNEINDKNTVEMDDGVENSDSEDIYLKSDSSSSGSWSIDDSIEFLQPAHKPLFDELPTFSIRSTSPSGHLTSIVNEPISLFNLSISPISSMEDLSRVNDQIDDRTTNEKNTKDLTQKSDSLGVGYDDDDRISLEDLTAQINTPPSMLSRSNKRLNLETIFEDVFLETPKKRKLKKFNSWRIETFQEITNDERINSYVIEQQQQNRHEQDNTCNDTFCNAFDDKIKINNTISDD